MDDVIRRALDNGWELLDGPHHRRPYLGTPRRHQPYPDAVHATDETCHLCRRRRATVIDHDHETHLLRGLLCRRCNMGLGYFGDDLAGILEAAAYLSAVAVGPRWSKNRRARERKARAA